MAGLVDDSELRAFSRDLERAAGDVAPQIGAVIKRGALNIKTQMVSEMRSSRHFKGTAASVSFDTRETRDGIEAEIGPDKDRGGALANVAYFGTSRGGGTVPDPLGALEREVPNLDRYIDDILSRLL